MRVLIENIAVSQIIKAFSNFVENESSIPCVKDPTTFSNLIQVNSVDILPFYFLKIHINIFLPNMCRSSKW